MKPSKKTSKVFLPTVDPKDNRAFIALFSIFLLVLTILLVGMVIWLFQLQQTVNSLTV